MTPADLGREVVCPVSRRFVAVPAGGVEFAAPPAAPAESSRRRRLPAGAALAALAVLLFCGFGGVSVRLYYGDKPVAGRDGVNGLTGADGKPAEVVVAAEPEGPELVPIFPPAASRSHQVTARGRRANQRETTMAMAIIMVATLTTNKTPIARSIAPKIG